MRVYIAVVTTALTFLVIAGGCTSEASQPVDPSRMPGNEAEGFPFEQALVACIQDNGIDSELKPNGVVSSDKYNTLSREEWRSLSDLCDQRLEDEGFVVHQEPSDELTERSYNAWVAFRECLIDQKIAVPELVSLETYAENRAIVGELIKDLIREDGAAFLDAYSKCPQPDRFLIVNVVGE